METQDISFYGYALSFEEHLSFLEKYFTFQYSGREKDLKALKKTLKKLRKDPNDKMTELIPLILTGGEEGKDVKLVSFMLWDFSGKDVYKNSKYLTGFHNDVIKSKDQRIGIMAETLSILGEIEVDEEAKKKFEVFQLNGYYEVKSLKLRIIL